MQASHCPCWDVPPWLVLNFLAFVRSLYCSLWCVFERLNDLDLLAYALFLAPLHRSQVFSPRKIKKDADPLLGTISSFCSGMLFVVYLSFSVALLIQTTSRKRGGSSCDWHMQARDRELI